MIQSVRGFKDIFGRDAVKWQKMEDLIRDGFRRWGFQEVKLPLLEKTELFERGIGDSTDIVEKEMYTFVDKGGERVTLRPEGTASVIRFFNEHKLYGTDRLFKFYYIGPMFRYERPQKGRLRQFHQAGVELLGDSSPLAELEVLSLVVFLVERLGIKDGVLMLNSLGCNLCRPSYREALVTYLSDRSDALCEDCKRRLKVNPLRILDCKSEGCKVISSKGPRISDFLCQDCKEHYETLKGLLRAQNIPFQENPEIVRGLDYYNRTVFEFHSAYLGAQSAILAGGRYDNLSNSLGGVNIPAVGWAMGMERVFSVIDEALLGLQEKLVFICSAGEGLEREVFSLVCAMRKEGIRAEFDFFKGSLKSQLRRADKLGADFVVIVGEEELKRALYIVKDMKRGGQEILSFVDLLNFLKQSI